MSVIKLRQGDDFRRRVRWLGVASAPLNLAGYTLSASISWAGGSVACVIDQQDLANGQYDISLQEEQTAVIPPGRLSKLSLRYVSPAGGTVTAFADVEGLDRDVLMPGTGAIDVIVSDQGVIEIAAIGIPGPPGGGGGGGGATNLSVIDRTASALTIASDTGSDAALPAATGTLAGLMLATDKAKLDTAPADIGAAIAARETAGVAASLMSGHLAAADPHPQYATPAEAAAAAPVQSVAGRTGAVTLAKGDVGLGNVDNTADANKPISNAVSTALAGKSDVGNAAAISDFAEAVDDRVAALLVAGSNVTLAYNDAANTLTISATGGGGGATNLSVANRTATALDVASDTGTDATIPAATGTLAGLMAAADKAKLDGVATSATANATDAALRDRATHTGTQASATISDFAEAVDDRVASLLVAGANITLAYNDAANTLTINAAGGGAGTDLSYTAATRLLESSTGADVTLPLVTSA
ncbi:MAG: hypothetical protein MUE97_08210, partial [Phycisphaerales bacterium]|nr:hypothetical protein [Phycisphaerales bacterium]